MVEVPLLNYKVPVLDDDDVCHWFTLSEQIFTAYIKRLQLEKMLKAHERGSRHLLESWDVFEEFNHNLFVLLFFALDMSIEIFLRNG